MRAIDARRKTGNSGWLGRGRDSDCMCQTTPLSLLPTLLSQDPRHLIGYCAAHAVAAQMIGASWLK